MKNAGKGSPYEDIIHLSRPVSGKYPPMPMEKRAAQFSPFAALAGHGMAVREVARLAGEKRELGEEATAAIGQKLYLLNGRQGEKLEINVTYFVPDEKKPGGQYATVTGRVKKVDVYGGLLAMEDGTRIYFDDISELSGELFDGFFETG